MGDAPIDDGPRGRPPWIWRFLVLGGAIGFGLVIAALIAFWGVYSYSHQSSAPITWAPVTIPPVGITAQLKTELLEGDVHYQFRVLPSSPEFSSPFDAAAVSDTSTKHFTLIFYDTGGFEVCRQGIETSHEVGGDGKTDALTSNGKLLLCSSDDYKRASRWNVAYNFPQLSKVETVPKTIPPSKGPSAGTIGGDDSLTGFGIIDHKMNTLSGHTFLIANEGEQLTAIGWSASARLRISCKPSGQCLIENKDNGEAIHGKALN